MFSRIGIHLTRNNAIYCRRLRLILSLNSSRHLLILPRRGEIHAWYRRFRPVITVFTIVSAGAPLGYLIYRDFIRRQLWFNSDNSLGEDFDDNTESVNQSEIDELLSHTQELLDAELYLNRSSRYIVPIRLLFRTLKLIIVLTPMAMFYYFQSRFAPHLYEKWCFTLKRSFEYCGPCFIKLGQWMATRPDLFSAQFCSIFSDLHSNAPTHSEATTKQVLSNNSIKIEQLTSDHLLDPIASGAIAQVYRCKINNDDFIMKIRHPDVQNKIFYDLKILNIFTRVLTKLVSKEAFRWLNIEDNIRSFTKNMLLQTNLMIEGKNLQIFERNFQKYKLNIRFPHVDPSLPLTKDVLFETYENGQLLNAFMANCRDLKVRKKLAYLGANAYLKMIFVDNFVHADLHPGNILVRVDENLPHEPIIIFLDVGLTSSLNRKDKKNFYDLFRAIVNYDGVQAATLLIEHAPNATEIDEQSKMNFRQDMSKLINTVLKTPLKQLEVGAILRNVLDLGKKYHIKMESSFTTLALGTIIFEGIGRQLDPDFDFVSAARPYLEKDFRLVKDYLSTVFKRNINTYRWSKWLSTDN